MSVRRGTRDALGAGIRSLLAASWLLGRRRARRDIGLLAALTALGAVTVLMAAGGPFLVTTTLDGGARQSVATVGSAADLRLTTNVGGASNSSQPVISPTQLLSIARSARSRLPGALAAVATSTTVTALGPQTLVREVDAEPVPVGSSTRVQLALLTPAEERGVHVATGRLPHTRAAGDTAAPVEVVVSAAGAQRASLRVGSVVSVTELDGLQTSPSTTMLTVVGIVARSAGSPESLWDGLPQIWTPTRSPATDSDMAFTGITVLAAPDGVVAAAATMPDPFNGEIRIGIASRGITSANESRVAAAVEHLEADPNGLAGGTGAVLTVRTGLRAALAAYPIEAHAALAQMSIMIAGVIGVAAAVLVLLSRLLVNRRATELALERARGTSVVAIGVRTLGESILTTVLGAAVGGAVAAAFSIGVSLDSIAVITVLLVSLLAAPVESMVLARGFWRGTRVAANRRERARAADRGRARRVVLEATIVALAVAAVVSLRGRGLLQTQSTGVDPLLAAAPLLLAIVVTLVVVRGYPLGGRAIGALGRRGRGALGILGAIRAERAVAVLPLFALTLGFALSVGGALLVGTVNTGQVEASWQRVGADVRIDAPLNQSQRTTLGAAPGVSSVASFLAIPGIELDLGTTEEDATVLAVDRHYPGLIAQQLGDANASVLRSLARPSTKTGAVPVIVDQALQQHLVTQHLSMYFGPAYVPLRVVGVTHVVPDGYLAGPFVYIDLAALSARMPHGLQAGTTLVSGSGAAAAAGRLGVSATEVTSRTEWLTHQRGLLLVSGVENFSLASVGAIALLAIIALVATVLGGSRERGRSLALLRTLGMRARLGWWLALAELTPMLIAALLGGSVAGLAIVELLSPALGLDVLAGGTSIPPPSIPAVVILALVGGSVLLLLIAVLAEVLAHRRDRLTDVLRVGETV